LAFVPVSDRPRVVVADDHLQVLHAATSILSSEFEVVASSPGGIAAVDAALRFRPDIVVLDIAMPEVDGFETAARIKAAGLEARIVFLSNHAGDDYVLAALSRGASAFVAKARMVSDLVPAVWHALSGRAFVPSASILPRWPRPAGRRHDVLMYATDAFLIDAVMAYFDSALEAGHALVAFGSDAHLQAFDAQFRRRSIDPSALAATGRYSARRATSALDAILRDGVPDPTLYAAAMDPLLDRALAVATSSPKHVSAFGEIAPILCARGDGCAMERLEQIAHEFIATRPVSLLCAYSTTLAGDGNRNDVLAGVCAAHSTIVPADA
jgi:CheY-like chemotaxis protein